MDSRWNVSALGISGMTFGAAKTGKSARRHLPRIPRCSQDAAAAFGLEPSGAVNQMDQITQQNATGAEAWAAGPASWEEF